MGKKQAKTTVPIDPVIEFWKQYPEAPYLLKVGDTILLASSEKRANDLARMAGIKAEKVYNPNLKTSTEDAS